MDGSFNLLFFTFAMFSLLLVHVIRISCQAMGGFNGVAQNVCLPIAQMRMHAPGVWGLSPSKVCFIAHCKYSRTEMILWGLFCYLKSYSLTNFDINFILVNICDYMYMRVCTKILLKCPSRQQQT